MARQKNDGRGRLGGRAKGVKNKDKPLKVLLRAHSLDYFMPDADGKSSRFDEDMASLHPHERVNAELQLLKFHTPQMQAASVDMAVSGEGRTITSLLSELMKDGGGDAGG